MELKTSDISENNLNLNQEKSGEINESILQTGRIVTSKSI